MLHLLGQFVQKKHCQDSTDLQKGHMNELVWIVVLLSTFHDCACFIRLFVGKRPFQYETVVCFESPSIDVLDS
jgi:hypothetical protein